jgi:4a-hydroxytetrahydrobiopterin dehydratase
VAYDKTPLTAEQLKHFLHDHPRWANTQEGIRRTFEFIDFRASIAFVNKVADAAEAANHHPDIDIRYSKVTLTLITHDAGGLTLRDTKLAAEAGAFATGLGDKPKKA